MLRQYECFTSSLSLPFNRQINALLRNTKIFYEITASFLELIVVKSYLLCITEFFQTHIVNTE